MKYPAIVFEKEKIATNIKNTIELCKKNGVDNVFAVTKSYSAFEPMIALSYECGIRAFADARIQNLRDINCPTEVEKLLLRIPMLSEIEDVVKYSTVSLNSELVTIEALSEEAIKQNKVHKVILMVDLGDLREGILPCDVYDVAAKVLELKGVKLSGVGVNLTCYGAVIPDDNNLGELCSIAKNIEEKFGIELEYVSGGNSSSVYKLFDKSLPSKINMLRIGEFLYYGAESSYGKTPSDMFNYPVTLRTQIVELKEKDSLPKGEIGVNAFGEKVTFEDKGKMLRAIVAIGRQDVVLDNLTPVDKSIELVGQSSDHTIIDLTHTKSDLKVGDIVEFELSYSSVLDLCTSKYVSKYME